MFRSQFPFFVMIGNTSPRWLRLLALYKVVRTSKNGKKRKRPRSILDSDVIVNPNVVQIFEKDAHWSNKSISSSIYFFYCLQNFRILSSGKISVQNRPWFFFFFIPSLRVTSYLRSSNVGGLIYCNCKSQENRQDRYPQARYFRKLSLKCHCFLQQLRRRINH